MAEQKQNNVELTDEEKEQRAKKRNRTVITVVSVAAAVLIVVIVLLLLLVKCEPEENVDPPVGHTHTYSSWVVVDEPTCTEEGLRECTCTCGEKETEMIEALGHAERAPVRENEKAPTCTAAGSYEEVVCCTVCEEELSRKTVTVDALRHTEGRPVVENATEGICTVPGSYEEVVYCTVCGEELSRKTVTGQAAGHDYHGVLTTEPLCTTEGEMTYTCTRCGDSYKETIAPLGHDWGEMQPGTAATCTEKGYSDHRVCSRCGIDDGNTIPAKGHTWGDWKVTTEATCTTAGEQKHTCSACGVEEKEEIAVDPTAHKPDETDYIANEKGHWFACSLCGTELKDETYEEHEYTGGEQNCTICAVTDSKYFNFTQLDDGSGYGIGQMVTVLDEPDDTNPENPYGSLPAFTDAVKLPDYYKDLPITELTGMTVEITIEIPRRDPLTIPLPFASFNLNTTLKSIELSNFITGISENAFAGCSELTSVNIPDSVTSIGDFAFDSCTSLAEIVIPDSVTEIGGYAFNGCTSLAEIEIPDSVTEIGYRIFFNCTSLESVTLPKGITTIVESMFSGCTSLTTIENLDSVTTIGDEAFKGCTSLNEGFEIPKGVMEIDYSAFLGCTSLTSITIPESVTSIGDYAFEGCDNLTSVVFADTTSTWEMKRYFDSSAQATFTPSTPEANAKALTDTYSNNIWTKQTD